MLSRRIDLAATEIGRAEIAKEERRAEYSKEESMRQPLPNELKESSLRALKQLLAEAKTKSDEAHAIAAAGPFSKMELAQIAIQREGALNIEPSSQVVQLYHKLLDRLITSARDGIQKTTFVLDSAAFNSSIFRNAQITIVEYSTAPKIFNIQFTADAKAVAFFEIHAANLQQVLNCGNHNFEIHRIDTSLQTETEHHLIEAIESNSEEEDHE